MLVRAVFELALFASVELSAPSWVQGDAAVSWIFVIDGVVALLLGGFVARRQCSLATLYGADGVLRLLIGWQLNAASQSTVVLLVTTIPLLLSLALLFAVAVLMALCALCTIFWIKQGSIFDTVVNSVALVESGSVLLLMALAIDPIATFAKSSHVLSVLCAAHFLSTSISAFIAIHRKGS